MSNSRSAFLATGSYLPPKKVSNHDISVLCDTDDQWIYKRTGIAHRHFVEDESCADLAYKAAISAIESANAGSDNPISIDAIIVATTTPDQTFPSVAARVHQMLGIAPCPFFDIQAVCSGFLYGLTMADNMIRLGQAQNILLIGAEVYSKIIDPSERGTYILFGDGAGAVILSGKNDHEGIIATKINGDGQFYDKLFVDGGVVSTQTAGIVRMAGREVFRHAVEKMSQIVTDICALTDYKITDIDWLVPHQANIRIMSQVANQLGIPVTKVIETVGIHGNISAATIPYALDHGFRNGSIKRGDLIALTTLGGGFVWGSALIRW